INVEDQKKLSDMFKGKKELTGVQKMLLLKDLRHAVLSNYGCSVYPIKGIPDLGSDACLKKIVLEKLYSGNLPIPQDLLEKLVDAFACGGKTDVDEVRTFLLVALGHERDPNNQK
ncbi:EF-hand domain-containing protein 1, partial [Nephila pilipes]